MSDAPPPDTAALPLQQSPECAAALNMLGRRTQVVSLEDGARRIGSIATIRIPGTRGLFASRGPIWCDGTTEEDRHHAFALLRRRGLWVVNAGNGCGAALSRNGYFQAMTAATTAELPLTPDWRARLVGTWRNALNKAEADQRANRLTLATRPFDPARDAWLLRAQARQAREKRYRPLPARFTLGFAQANPGAVQLFEARQEGKIIAAMLFLRHGVMATYHLAWSDPAAARLGAHRLLLGKAVPWLIGRGHGRLDLGVIDTERAPGLARFKLGLGADAAPQGGTWIKGPRIRVPGWSVRALAAQV